MGWRDDLKAAARFGAGYLGETLLKAAQDGNNTKDEQDEDQDRGPGGTDQDSAENAPVPDEQATQDPKALFWDPFAIVEQVGYKERHSQITYGTLRAMAWKMPVIHAIIQTRVNQVAAFAHPQPDRFKLGYQLKLRDSEKAPSRQDKAWTKQMSVLIQRTGVTDNPRGRDTFEEFLRKSVYDSLTFDQMTWELVPNRKGQPAEWYAIDASTIRLADSSKLFYDEDDIKSPRYVQIYDGQIITEYNQQELCFGIRNPTTNMRNYGYGESELERLVSTITAMLWSWEYNAKFFSQGSSQKGILNFKGAIPERQLKSFRRHWHQMVSGVENAWRTPITNADELQWINMQASNRDMEFSAWMDFLIKVACFTPDTLATMADGSQKRMDHVLPGDFVITHTGKACKVNNVQASQHDGNLVWVKVPDLTIKSTPEHPYRVVEALNGGSYSVPVWVEAKDLLPGKHYLTAPDKEPIKVESATMGYYRGTVYNLEVADDHTYLANGVSVHNCSMYSMDPVEVNFKYGNTGQKGGLQEANNKEKITESKERGLRPLLRFIESNINQHILWPINEDFVFQFVGLDAQTRDDEAKLFTQRVKTTWTVDELRAEEDKPPLPDGMGAVILDPTWMQFKQAKDGMAQQGGDGGDGENPFGNTDEGEGDGDKGDDEDVDFEAMMAENDEDDNEDDNEDENDNKKKDVKKSMTSGNVVIDLKI